MPLLAMAKLGDPIYPRFDKLILKWNIWDYCHSIEWFEFRRSTINPEPVSDNDQNPTSAKDDELS